MTVIVVEDLLMRTGVGGDHGTSALPEGVRLIVCSAETSLGEEVCNLGRAMEAEGSEWERRNVLGEVSKLLFVAQVVTGFGEAAAI